jgi:NAD(P)-dependent dehydrogenase (short-subunit alcohol dehydrogenase family)
VRFQDKVVVITGGTSGIGLAAAREFASEGAKLAIVGRGAGALAAVRAEIPTALTIAADVGEVSEIERVMSEVERTHGGIDVLFATPGCRTVRRSPRPTARSSIGSSP